MPTFDREPGSRWLSTEEAGARVGMTGAWVRKQVELGRLRAVIFETGARSTLRIRPTDWAAFLARFSRSSDIADS